MGRLVGSSYIVLHEDGVFLYVL